MNEVLLAEDEAVSRRFLEDALAALGHRCESVSDGGRALDAAIARHFDVLLLDVNLPQLSGPEVLRQLRASANAASRDVPAIALTADHEIDTEHHLLDAGFLAVGTKPIDVLALERLLAQVHSPAPTSAARPATPSTSRWDEDAALAAAGGQREIVAALRALMRKELPAQRTAILSAIHRKDREAARSELHRLRAACGFCGAAELGKAVDGLDAALDEPAIPQLVLTHFLAAMDRVLDPKA
jgi:CheY-like chemotaxis protein